MSHKHNIYTIHYIFTSIQILGMPAHIYMHYNEFYISVDIFWF